MSKKLSLTKETLRLLVSTDALEAIATDATPAIVGGKKHHHRPRGPSEFQAEGCVWVGDSVRRPC